MATTRGTEQTSYTHKLTFCLYVDWHSSISTLMVCQVECLQFLRLLCISAQLLNGGRGCRSVCCYAYVCVCMHVSPLTFSQSPITFVAIVVTTTSSTVTVTIPCLTITLTPTGQASHGTVEQPDPVDPTHVLSRADPLERCRYRQQRR